MSQSSEVQVSPDQHDSLRAILSVIHAEQPIGRSEIARLVDLGRAVVGVRVAQLIELGVVRERGLGASLGGRRAMELEVNRDAGLILTADLGATSVATGITDVAGTILEYDEESAQISDGPAKTLSLVRDRFDRLIAQYGRERVWAIGVGVPGPVEFATGVTISPPIMPGWDGFSVREFFESAYGVPTWVDNDVNVMALAEARAGAARGLSDSIYVKVGTGIGAGLITQGQLHRGARGSAGDIGHIAVSTDPAIICICGNTGCLEAVAGGAALARQGAAIGSAGRSQRLGEAQQRGKSISAEDVANAAGAGDHAANQLIQQAGQTLGTTLAGLINFYNPDMVVIGGGVSQAGGGYLAAIRETIYRRSLPLATRDLQVVLHSLGNEVGVKGCAIMVIEELLRPEVFSCWIERGRPDLAAIRA